MLYFCDFVMSNITQDSTLHYNISLHSKEFLFNFASRETWDYEVYNTLFVTVKQKIQLYPQTENLNLSV